jgi:hypothetical protein
MDLASKGAGPQRLIKLLLSLPLLATILFLFSDETDAGRRLTGNGTADHEKDSLLARLASTGIKISPTWLESASIDLFRGSPVAIDSAVFERLQHFKDVGIPATTDNLVARSAIADGICRLIKPGVFDGYDFWHHNWDRVNTVLKAVADLPPTTQPSKFVHAARAMLGANCTAGSSIETNSLELYSAPDVAAALSNWHRALCDPLLDDPADEPQQQALTTGFVCIVSCDVAGLQLPAASLHPFLKSANRAKSAAKDICRATPWHAIDGPVVKFANMTTYTQIRDGVQPWLMWPCNCAPSFQT